MKKKLEAELISIAHRILKLKNKDDIRGLHHESQKLYEKLSILLFVEENFGEIKPTIGLQQIEEKMISVFEQPSNTITTQEVNYAIQQEITQILEGKEEKSSSILDQIVNTPQIIETTVPQEQIKQMFEETKIVQEVNQVQEKTTPPTAEKPVEKQQLSIEELLENLKETPIFDKVVEPQNNTTTQPEEVLKNEPEIPISQPVNNESKFLDVPASQELVFEKKGATPPPSTNIATNLNDKLKKTITIGLNDRIAFEKNLFGGSSEDYNRVISQLSSFENIEEAKHFIDIMVKPDYNFWAGKEEYAMRFMEIVETKFS